MKLNTDTIITVIIEPAIFCPLISAIETTVELPPVEAGAVDEVLLVSGVSSSDDVVLEAVALDAVGFVAVALEAVEVGALELVELVELSEVVDAA